MESGQTTSPQFHDAFRRLILSAQYQPLKKALDLADLMRTSSFEEKGTWFYPNDRHLTPTGHLAIAKLLSVNLV